MNDKDTVVYVAKALFKSGKSGLDIVQKYFKHIIVIPYDEYTHGTEGKQQILRHMQGLKYDYIISFWSELYIPQDLLLQATKGAVNIHPAPPEHPGLGMFTCLRLFPHLRAHHGVTLHEMDYKLDHGKIYRAARFPVGDKDDLTLVKETCEVSLQLLEDACRILSTGALTHALQDDACRDETWHESLYTIAMEKEWLRHLPEDDPVRRLDCDSRNSIFYVECGAAHDSMGVSDTLV